MRIITKKAIVLFYTKHADSKTALEEWYSKTNKADWNNFAELKKDFKTVDAIGNNRNEYKPDKIIQTTWCKPFPYQ